MIALCLRATEISIMEADRNPKHPSSIDSPLRAGFGVSSQIVTAMSRAPIH